MDKMGNSQDPVRRVPDEKDHQSVTAGRQVFPVKDPVAVTVLILVVSRGGALCGSPDDVPFWFASRKWCPDNRR